MYGGPCIAQPWGCHLQGLDWAGAVGKLINLPKVIWEASNRSITWIQVCLTSKYVFLTNTLYHKYLGYPHQAGWNISLVFSGQRNGWWWERRDEPLEILSWDVSVSSLTLCLGHCTNPISEPAEPAYTGLKTFLHLISCSFISVDWVWLVFCSSICKCLLFPNQQLLNTLAFLFVHVCWGSGKPI